MQAEISLAQELGIDISTLDALEDYTKTYAAEIFGEKGAAMDEGSKTTGASKIGGIESNNGGEVGGGTQERDVIISELIASPGRTTSGWKKPLTSRHNRA
ncbi:hypothetical protein FACS189490_04150 [Clostridia bacterium]|nr:hypothetical protein FACS189490_04150 [Clostridia bacterium]